MDEPRDENLWREAAALVRRLNRWLDSRDGDGPADFEAWPAFRYEVRDGRGVFAPVRRVDPITAGDLLGIDRQWSDFDRNTRQLLRRLPCNHVLLWGARGTGKSSLVKASLNAHREQGLRVVEVRRSGLLDLPRIVEAVAGAEQAFLILLDDITFEDDDPLARELKALLEGGVQEMPSNARVVATANRRHLMPRRSGENAWSDDDDLHLRDAAEEKTSLADRFGLRLGFPPLSEAGYLAIVKALARQDGEGPSWPELRQEAVSWGRSHGVNGRSARQFLDDRLGRRLLEAVESAGEATPAPDGKRKGERP